MMLQVVPVVIAKEVDCIIQNGKRYCEKSDTSGHEVGIILLGMVGWIMCAIGCASLGERVGYPGLGILCGICIPPLVVGLVLLCR